MLSYHTSRLPRDGYSEDSSACVTPPATRKPRIRGRYMWHNMTARQWYGVVFNFRAFPYSQREGHGLAAASDNARVRMGAQIFGYPLGRGSRSRQLGEFFSFCELTNELRVRLTLPIAEYEGRRISEGNLCRHRWRPGPGDQPHRRWWHGGHPSYLCLRVRKKGLSNGAVTNRRWRRLDGWLHTIASLVLEAKDSWSVTSPSNHPHNAIVFAFGQPLVLLFKPNQWGESLANLT